MIFGRQPLVLDRVLAALLGLNEAIVLEQIHYWIEINRKGKRNFHDGRTWTYNSMEDWAKEFPFWSYATVKRTFRRLREAKILITGNYNLYPMDKTLWYTIDYGELERLLPDDTPIGAKGTKEISQDDPMEGGEMVQAIPESSTKNSSRDYDCKCYHKSVPLQSISLLN